MSISGAGASDENVINTSPTKFTNGIALPLVSTSTVPSEYNNLGIDTATGKLLKKNAAGTAFESELDISKTYADTGIAALQTQINTLNSQVGNAILTTNPADTPSLTAFNVQGGAGTYTYFLAAASTPIVFDNTADSMATKNWQMRKVGTYWQKYEVKTADLSAYTTKASLDPRVNIWQYTENLGSNRYIAGSGTIDATQTTLFKGITLSKFSSANFYGGLRSQLSGLALNILTPGKLYLFSCYIQSLREVEQMIWMRSLASTSSNGHGKKLIDGEVRRIWCVKMAVDATHVDSLPNPAVAMGTGASQDPYWFVMGSLGGDGTADVRIGGFQIELLPDGYKDGIAAIGDSTIQGGAGSVDGVAARETCDYIGALLNVNVYNRGIGGQRTDQMDARWATDITPLAPNCKDVIIQGGINDIKQSRALSDIQTSITSMYTKALADGLRPIFFTCTPTADIGTTPAMETTRVALNIWLKRTFPNVLDIAAIVCDPANPSQLRQNADWVGDGTHYGLPAKRAIANAVAHWGGWDFITPADYQQVLVTTPYVKATPLEKPKGVVAYPKPLGIYTSMDIMRLGNRGTLTP